MPWRWHWRALTWVLLAWLCTLPVWYWSAIWQIGDVCPLNARRSAFICPNLAHGGAAVVMLVGIYGAVLLGTPVLIWAWFKTRPPRLRCAECHTLLGRGVTLCPTCHLEALPPAVEGHAVRRLR